MQLTCQRYPSQKNRRAADFIGISHYEPFAVIGASVARIISEVFPNTCFQNCIFGEYCEQHCNEKKCIKIYIDVSLDTFKKSFDAQKIEVCKQKMLFC